MRPVIVIAASFSLTVAAVAADDSFNGEAAAAAYNDFRSGCRIGEMWGTNISDDESDKACIAVAALAEQLKSHGYCWSDSEVEWALCEK
jgi:hypothetical protein